MNVAMYIASSTHPEAALVQQPVEALYASALLRQAGHAIALVDRRVDPVSRLDSFRADAVFVVTETYDRSQCFTLDLTGAQETVEFARSHHPGVPIVAVGVHGTIEPEATLATLATDSVLAGELETAIPAAVVTLERQGGLAPIVGLSPPVDVATLPIPDYGAVDVSSYKGEVVRADGGVEVGVSGLMYANRGCPYSCSYCYVWPSRLVRRRPIDKVIDELATQRARGISDFFFLDYTFTVHRQWAMDLCQAIRESHLAISWVCQTRVERVDPELLSAMNEAGCAGIWFGIESPWIESAHLQKPISLEAIENAISWTRDAGILCLLFILVGLGESHRNKESGLIPWLLRMPVNFFAQPLLPRPGTSLWRAHSLASPTTWPEIAETARSIAVEHYWYPEMDALLDRLATLPNNVNNIPVVPSARGTLKAT